MSDLYKDETVDNPTLTSKPRALSATAASVTQRLSKTTVPCLPSHATALHEVEGIGKCSNVSSLHYAYTHKSVVTCRRRVLRADCLEREDPYHYLRQENPPLLHKNLPPLWLKTKEVLEKSPGSPGTCW